MSDYPVPGRGSTGTMQSPVIPDKARHLYDRAFEHLSGGETEDALCCFREAVEIAPDFTPALHEIGNCLSDLGRHEEASEYYNRALEEIGDRLYTIARQEEAMGRYWRAIGWYEEAGKYFGPDPAQPRPSENGLLKEKTLKK